MTQTSLPRARASAADSTDHRYAGRRAPGHTSGRARRRAERAASRDEGTRRAGPGAYAFLLVVLLASVFPLWWSFLIGSKDAAALNADGIPLLPGGNFLKNARTVVDTVPFWKAFTNSVIVSSTVAFSVVALSTLAGFAFAKLRFRGRDGLMVFVVATMAVPTQLGVVPLFIVMSKLGWVGSVGAVIVPALVNAFGVFWMTQYLRESLPDELVEAARVDGCSMIRTFWHVALPASRPGAAMLGLFTFIATWTNFFWPFIVLEPGNPTLPVALQQLQAAHYVDYSLVLAGVVLAAIPLIIVFVLAGRQLVAGIMQGAVKG
ncbi:cellobiose ABC transporter membrane protein [Pedococcus cremeus]|uniref:Cellobiose ABC transporter membrane protein n=1 Tax=Pedococcus cremeus TaxID=587636 RepID=A0A1H9W2G7_9MICO|nr:carbohydrate ABC transporter permease [Pedococcus cremeus]SES28048.1 cellobiose ABC transporter membrane protein [Pedococcus cremeus]